MYHSCFYLYEVIIGYRLGICKPGIIADLGVTQLKLTKISGVKFLVSFYNQAAPAVCV